MPTDIVVPIKNEHELIQMARRLGYDQLVLAYTKKPEHPLPANPGIPLHLASIDRPAPWAGMCIATAKTDSRGLLEHKAISGIADLEISSPKDFMHQRASGLNHVLANIASAKRKLVIFDFSLLLHHTGPERSTIMGRMSQNIRLCTKALAPMAIASMASNPYHMRSPHDLACLFSVLGMHPAQAKVALNAFNTTPGKSIASSH